MFTPSTELAAIVPKLRCAETQPHDLPHLDLTSENLDEAGSPDANVGLVAQAIGERLVRLLETVARRTAMQNPSQPRVLIVEQGRFPREVRLGMMERLGLVNDRRVDQFLDNLAREFAQWVWHLLNSKAENLGFSLDARGNVYLECPEVYSSAE